MSDEVKVEATQATDEKIVSKKNKKKNNIASLKKQVRWLTNMMNDLIGNSSHYLPVVKVYKGSIDKTTVDTTVIPTRTHATDSCFDICAHFPTDWEEAIKINPKLAKTRDHYDANDNSVTIGPMETIILPTNISVELPKNFECQCRPRSGLTSKGILVGWGTVDEDYSGDIGIILTNTTNKNFVVKNNERIGQLAFVRKCPVILEDHTGEEPTRETDRGANGFGSSGV